MVVPGLVCCCDLMGKRAALSSQDVCDATTVRETCRFHRQATVLIGGTIGYVMMQHVCVTYRSHLEHVDSSPMQRDLAPAIP